MKLTEVIAVWDELHTRDTGELGYNDLELAIGQVCGIENDVDASQPSTAATAPATKARYTHRCDKCQHEFSSVYDDVATCPSCGHNNITMMHEQVQPTTVVDVSAGREVSTLGVTKEAWPDPTQEMLASKEFSAVWEAIKTWDINVPAQDGDLYSGATGNHARAILDALASGSLENRKIEIRDCVEGHHYLVVVQGINGPSKPLVAIYLSENAKDMGWLFEIPGLTTSGNHEVLAVYVQDWIEHYEAAVKKLREVKNIYGAALLELTDALDGCDELEALPDSPDMILLQNARNQAERILNGE